ncbi:MAG: hypothetical protein H0X40_15235 [Chthoniobacterales bacterium]|nr:hypothetical protein [Chthoniobacterales bacterium]
MYLLRIFLLVPFFSPQLIRAAEPSAIQIEVKDILNARVVTVVKGGALVPLHETIDGAGGLATQAAVALMGNKNAHPLPDHPTFPATDRHPEAVLHYANEDAASNQVRRAQGEDTFFFSVSPNHYSHLHIYCTSGWGASQLQVKLIYEDQPAERRSLEIPDWYWEIKPNDPVRSYLATNLGKWTSKNQMAEQDHHYIFALDLTPAPGRVLTRVAIHKLDKGLMGFYGATGTLAQKE